MGRKATVAEVQAAEAATINAARLRVREDMRRQGHIARSSVARVLGKLRAQQTGAALLREATVLLEAATAIYHGAQALSEP